MKLRLSLDVTAEGGITRVSVLEILCDLMLTRLALSLQSITPQTVADVVTVLRSLPRVAGVFLSM
ncbi:MAG: hypothetical protein P8P54_06120 [Pseudomonadales bacterium]|nr:hypothetical protein [Pseudomonadales bacterium]